MELWDEHVVRPVVQVDRPARLLALDRDAPLAIVFALIDDLSMLGDAQVADLAENFDLVGELVNESASILHAVLPVVGVEGGWEHERVVAADDLQRVNDVDPERRKLAWEQVAQLDGHCLLLLLALGDDSRISAGDGVVVSFPRLLFRHDLSLHDLVVYHCLKLGKQGPLLQWEDVCAFQWAVLARVRVDKLDCGRSCRAPELTLHIDFSERQQNSLFLAITLRLCIEEVLAPSTALLIVAKLRRLRIAI